MLKLVHLSPQLLSKIAITFKIDIEKCNLMMPRKHLFEGRVGKSKGDLIAPFDLYWSRLHIWQQR